MKALTVRQPWASLIAVGAKTIETRSWSTSYRGPLAIHAGLTYVPCVKGELGTEWWSGSRVLSRHGVGPEQWIHLPLGAVVATCTLADVLPTVDFMQERRDVRARVEQIDGVSGPRPSTLWVRRPGVTPAADITDQLPFGDFTPGRFAWLLEDITPLAEPIPAKGRQGLWEWDSEVAA